MSPVALVSWCPHCPLPVSGGDDGFGCDVHGRVVPLWRTPVADYDSFAEHLGLADEVPTYVPWPMSPGWRISDFACVTAAGGPALATVTTTIGSSSLDGEVSVTLVVEEPGVGLGARCSHTDQVDPGEPADVPGSIRIRVDNHPVRLWPVSSGAGDDVLARSVFAGEAGGRWLWLVMSPASAALLLRDEWLFADAGAFGPGAVELPFGGDPQPW
ncbi:MAG: hypothetical protein JWO46_2250 [Nocardioidaceae bacterium]|nr:hypothetical protein [Nocardioidaceae bacterium]